MNDVIDVTYRMLGIMVLELTIATLRYNSPLVPLQLGLGDDKDQTEPQEIAALSLGASEVVTSVQAGSTMSAAVTNSGASPICILLSALCPVSSWYPVLSPLLSPLLSLHRWFMVILDNCICHHCSHCSSLRIRLTEYSDT